MPELGKYRSYNWRRTRDRELDREQINTHIDLSPAAALRSAIHLVQAQAPTSEGALWRSHLSRSVRWG